MTTKSIESEDSRKTGRTIGGKIIRVFVVIILFSTFSIFRIPDLSDILYAGAIDAQNNVSENPFYNNALMLLFALFPMYLSLSLLICEIVIRRFVHTLQYILIIFAGMLGVVFSIWFATNISTFGSDHILWITAIMFSTACAYPIFGANAALKLVAGNLSALYAIGALLGGFFNAWIPAAIALLVWLLWSLLSVSKGMNWYSQDPFQETNSFTTAK